MKKFASILDWPRPTLEPLIWNEDQTLKPEVKTFILDFVHSFAQANNFKHFDEWVTGIRIVGSLCTNTYNSHSDCDVHIAVDLKKYIELENVKMSEEEASAHLNQNRKLVDQVKAQLPGTEHPVELYFENEFTPPVRMEWSGPYDLFQDKWTSEPTLIKKDFDVSEFYPDLIETAQEVANEVYSSFGEVKREIKDIKELEETVEAWPQEQRAHFEQKLQKKLDSLDEEIKGLVDIREDILDKRHKSTHTISQPEITMKYLQKYFYINILTDLKTLLKQSPELTTKDIPVVENIMQQANLKEAAYKDMDSQERCDQVIMVDFDDTIAHENQDHTLEEPLTGAKEVLQDLKNQGYYIVIDSARANEWEGEDEIKEYLDKYDIPYDEIFQGNKPLAFRYIDDRAIQMTTWQDVLKKVEEAKGTDTRIGKECSLSQKYWIDPSGKEYVLNSNEGHEEWAIHNTDSLKEKYKLPSSAFGGTSYISDNLLRSDWTRVTTGYESSDYSDFAMEVADLKRLPSHLDNFVAKHFEGKGVEIDDLGGNYVKIMDPFPSLQKAVNQASRQPMMAAQALSKKEATGFNPYGDPKYKEGPAYAVFEHIQPGFGPFPDMEMYTILGNHPMFGSTVQKSKIEELGIPIKQAKVAQLGSEYDYSSTQFNLPKELSEKIIRWAVENIPEENIVYDSVDPGTKGIQLESHVTLKYGLLTDNFEEVQKALEGEKAPHIKFGKTHFFEPEGKDYDVVIIVVESEDLQNLNKKLCDAVKHEDTQGSEYHPHVTVAYVKKGLGKNYDGKDIITGEEIDLDVLVFSPKEGEKRELELVKATEKESSFMPSNTDLAPSDDWAGTVGYPTNEAMDAPQNKSDEETWYSPQNDRPRTKTFWQKMLSLFKKPLSKKEPKNIVPVKEASSNVFMLTDVGTGSQTKALKDPTPDQAENLFNSAKPIEGEGKTLRWAADVNGHLYMWDAYYLIHYHAIKQIPADFGHDANTGILHSAEQARDWARRFQKDWEVRRQESPDIVFTSKQASSNVFMLETDSGFQTKVLRDPIPEQAANLFNSTRGEAHQLRWFIPVDGHLYMWDAYDITHWDAIKQIGIPATKFNEDLNSGVVRTEQEAEIVAEEFKEFGTVKVAKQWVTPTEPANQPGMAWGWADYIHNYVDENWQDWLLGWLELDPKNYVKPVVIIEYLYEDEGKVSAQVHIEFVNTSGQSDAFMKLIITADTHYEPSYEPEGVETFESLENFEIEVLEYGKSDELEKTSGYGPTNYQGPSVDTGYTYQDSPYEMNVTYSPEEDEELMDQNGKGGYPNRWMSRHRGPYYTNEGKVLKMLEETSAALSKKDINKKAIGPMSGWLAPDGQFYVVNNSHDTWIDQNLKLLEKMYKLPINELKTPQMIEGGNWVDWLISHGWARVDGYIPSELDFQIADIKSPPRSIENLVWKYNPKVVILEDLQHNDIALDDFSEGLDGALRNPVASLKVKAALSYQMVNNILNLIHNNGGATYNIASNKNMVGTDAYAVAIYPDREQIVEGLDFDRLEGYLVDNGDLLNSSNNSFGAWVSGGKVYLDVVATVPDKEQAMELGRKYNQLAIFDLKNLVEIPLQRVAKLAAAVSDREQQKYYDEIYSDRWRDDSSPIDAGNEYNKGWSELNGNDYPSPKDLDKERALLDQLEKPIDRNMPTGLGEYAITYYDAFPDQGDQGGI
jgi:2'-5' RNA ligase